MNETESTPAESSGVETIVTALVVAAAIAVVAIVLPRIVSSVLGLRIVTTQLIQLFLPLLAILVLGGGDFAAYGFRMPDREIMQAKGTPRWWLWGPGAFLLGMAATFVMLLSGGGGNPLVKELSFFQIVLFVWISASIVEEILTRGFLQGHLLRARSMTRDIKPIGLNLSALVSAVFFAAMHLVLLVSGVDFASLIVTLFFTFSLGLISGQLRYRTGSLLPSVLVHMLANIGGVGGGIIYAIITILTGGTLPNM
jgi:membrane protease YdiL (CAAX protease family)